MPRRGIPGAITVTAGVARLVFAVARAATPHAPQPHHLFRHHTGGIP